MSGVPNNNPSNPPLGQSLNTLNSLNPLGASLSSSQSNTASQPTQGQLQGQGQSQSLSFSSTQSQQVQLQQGQGQGQSQVQAQAPLGSSLGSLSGSHLTSSPLTSLPSLPGHTHNNNGINVVNGLTQITIPTFVTSGQGQSQGAVNTHPSSTLTSSASGNVNPLSLSNGNNVNVGGSGGPAGSGPSGYQMMNPPPPSLSLSTTTPLSVTITNNAAMAATASGSSGSLANGLNLPMGLQGNLNNPSLTGQGQQGQVQGQGLMIPGQPGSQGGMIQNNNNNPPKKPSRRVKEDDKRKHSQQENRRRDRIRQQIQKLRMLCACVKDDQNSILENAINFIVNVKTQQNPDFVFPFPTVSHADPQALANPNFASRFMNSLGQHGLSQNDGGFPRLPQGDGSGNLPGSLLSGSTSLSAHLSNLPNSSSNYALSSLLPFSSSSLSSSIIGSSGSLPSLTSSSVGSLSNPLNKLSGMPQFNNPNPSGSASALLSLLPTVVFGIDGRVTEAAPSLIDLFGFSINELCVCTLLAIDQPCQIAHTLAMIQHLLTNHTNLISTNRDCLDKKGNVKQFTITIAPLKEALHLNPNLNSSVPPPPTPPPTSFIAVFSPRPAGVSVSPSESNSDSDKSAINFTAAGNSSTPAAANENTRTKRTNKRTLAAANAPTPTASSNPSNSPGTTASTPANNTAPASEDVKKIKLDSTETPLSTIHLPTNLCHYPVRPGQVSHTPTANSLNHRRQFACGGSVNNSNNMNLDNGDSASSLLSLSVVGSSTANFSHESYSACNSSKTENNGSTHSPFIQISFVSENDSTNSSSRSHVPSFTSFSN